MQTVIIKPKNACAAAEFMAAVSPLWLADDEMPAFFRKHPEQVFLDPMSGDVRASAVNWPEDKIVIRHNKGSMITRQSRYVYADDSQLTAYASLRMAGGIWQKADGFFARRMYPLTATLIEVRDGCTMVELALELDGIWSSWSEYNADNGCDRDGDCGNPAIDKKENIG